MSFPKIWIFTVLFFFCLGFLQKLEAQTGHLYGSIKGAENQQPIGKAMIYLAPNQQIFHSDNKGFFHLKNLPFGAYEIQIFADNFSPQTQQFELQSDSLFLSVSLSPLSMDLAIVEVNDQQSEFTEWTKLKNVEGVSINAGRKNEVILVSNLEANLATNNARQIYKGIPGINIWENDAAGLQLSIGTRGLNPNRSANINTRQNGYDISADALGYPESYYTPPSQALEKIEVVRGAASLQYGPQFGGLLNFIFKKGKEKPIGLRTENTVGSYGLFNTFNSLGGSKNGWNYYSFYQYKRGNGWRENSSFQQHAAYLSLEKRIAEKTTLGIQYTHMNYLAQQAGGLVDFEFAQNPRQSKRSRNWFQVNWNLASASLDHQFSNKTKLNSRFFFLSAQRNAIGELGSINRPDPMRDRDLVKGNYLNFGNETRLIHRYHIKDQPTTLLVGIRYYQGNTKSEQGFGNDGEAADFHFNHPEEPTISSYTFPGNNWALFAENLFNLSDKLSITPGIRVEYIKTSAKGYFKNRLIAGNQVLYESKENVQKKNARAFALMGIGLGYRITNEVEFYSNISQNYRSINFSDLAVVNPNLVVDSLLQDERGFNFDLGIRGAILKNKALRFDLSLFHLKYNNRIGLSELLVEDPIVIEKVVAFRTNIGNAGIWGLESYMELDFWKWFAQNPKQLSLSIFSNLSWINGKYLTGSNAIKGKQIEYIPPLSLKLGLNLKWKGLRFSFQESFVNQHFSDATNASQTADATRGLIPSYHVQDLSMSYLWKKRYKVGAGINNLSNKSYFTRRATSYPGPGIIPAEGRNFYVTLGIQF